MKKWSKSSIIWLIIALVLILGTIIFKHINISNTNNILTILSDITSVCGIIYVISIARQEKNAYWFGIVNVVLYAVITYSKGLYISAGYNIFYSLPVLIYGYISWSNAIKNGTDKIKRFSNKTRIIGVLSILLIIIGLSFVSKNMLNGNNVILDSTASVTACIATFLLTKKYIEQWVLFTIGNFAGIVLFFIESINDIGSIDLLAMWIIYFINSIYGYFVWRKSLMLKEVGDAKDIS